MKKIGLFICLLIFCLECFAQSKEEVGYWKNAGNAAWKAKNYRGAAENWERYLIAVNFNDTACVYNLAVCGLKLKAYAATEKYFDMSIKNGYKLESAYRGKLDCLTEQNKWIEAIDFIQKGLQALPDNERIETLFVVTHIKMAQIQQKQNKWQEAYDILQQGLQLLPSNDDLRVFQKELLEKAYFNGISIQESESLQSPSRRTTAQPIQQTTGIGSYFCTQKKYSDRENDLLVGNVQIVQESHEDFSRPINNYTIVKTYDQIGMYVSKELTNGILQDIYDWGCLYIIKGYVKNRMHEQSKIFSALSFYRNIWDISFSFANERKLTYQYNANNQVIKIGSYYTYEYDENGNLCKRSYLGKPMLQFHWTDNKLTKVISYKENGFKENIRGTNCMIDWDVDGFNEVVTYEDGYRCVFLFDNQKIKMMQMNEGFHNQRGFNPKKFAFTVHYTYNSQGFISRETYKNDKGLTDKELIYEYDGKGNLTQCIIVYPQNSSASQKFEWEYTYDNTGNWVTREFFEIKRGDIEVRNRKSKDTRVITYFD